MTGAVLLKNTAAGIGLVGDVQSSVIRSNTIGGSSSVGIYSAGSPTNNLIDYNYIGTNAADANFANGDGIRISFATNNTFTQNIIGHNTTSGIDLSNVSLNTFSNNSIYSNGEAIKINNGTTIHSFKI